MFGWNQVNYKMDNEYFTTNSNKYAENASKNETNLKPLILHENFMREKKFFELMNSNFKVRGTWNEHFYIWR